MKKIIVFLLCLALIVPALCIFSSAATTKLPIYKITAAPKIDGELDTSYKLIADSKANKKLFNIATGGKTKNQMQIYGAWDDTNMYLFIKVDCNDPHVAYKDDAEKHWIFNAHHLMTAICPDDSSKSIYTGKTDTHGGFDWSSLYNANFMYEYTTIANSKTNQKEIADHFSNMSTTAGFEYEAKHIKGYDCYEQKIPLKSLKNSKVTSFTPKVGAVIGIGLAVGLVDVGNDYQDAKESVYFSNYFLNEDGNKTVNGLTLLEFKDNTNPSESTASTPAESTTSTESVVSEVSSAPSESSVPTDSSVAAESKVDAESKEASTVSTASNPASNTSDTQSGNETSPWVWVGVVAGVLALGGGAAYFIFRKKS